MEKLFKKVFFVLSLVALLGGGLLSCSSGDDDEETKTISSSSDYKEDAMKTLSSIAVNASKAQKQFSSGAKFTAEGIVVTATYSNGTKANVTSKAEYSYTVGSTKTALISGETALAAAAGKYIVTVSYTEAGVTKTGSYEIELTTEATLSSITVDTTNARTEYIKNTDSVFDSTGIVVTAKYSDDSTKDVSASAEFDKGTFNVSQLGTYTITVKYTEKGETKTATYSVKVVNSNTTETKTDVNNIEYTALKTSAVDNLQGYADVIDVKANSAESATKYKAGPIDWANPLISDASTIEGFTFMADVYYATGAQYDGLLYFYNPDSSSAKPNFLGLFENGNIRGSNAGVTADAYYESVGNTDSVTFKANANSWNKLAVTIDSTGTITYYINGVAGIDPTGGKGASVTWDVIKAQLTQQLTNIGIGIGNDWWAAGYVDEGNLVRDLRVYGTALTAEQVQKVFIDSCSDIAITVPETTVEFLKNATFNAEGVSVSGKLGNSAVDLTPLATVDSSAVKMNEPGTYTVTVNFGSESKSYNVEVKAVEVTAISVTTAPTVTTYPVFVKDVTALNLSGMVVTASYNDNTTGTLALSDLTIGVPTAKGSNDVSISYGEKTATVTVTVTNYYASIADIAVDDSWKAIEKCGYTGSYTSNEWWIEISTGDVDIPVGSAKQTVFTNNSYGEKDWSGAVYRIANSDSTTEFAVCRNDNYGWGAGYDGAALASNWNWSSVVADVTGSTQYVTVVNNGATIDLYLHFVKDGAVIHYQSYTGIHGDGNTIKFRPMGDAGADITYCEN